MKKSLKKRGQKIIKRFSRFNQRAEIKGKEHIKENFLGRLSHIKDIKILIFEWGLLVFALIMLAITQSIWFGNSYSTSAFVSGDTYTEGTIGRVNSMNPLFATTDSEKALSHLLFSNLATIDYSGNIGGGLASTIRKSENGRIWTIKLRENLKWSDGEPITNEDVIFTTSLIKNSSAATVYDSNLSGVKVTELETGEIEFALPSIYADFDTMLNFPIVPKHILGEADPKTLVEHSFSTNPITSGAFTFNATQNTSAEDEKIIYLSANPYYYKGKPLLDSFAIHAYSNKDALIKGLNSGKITATAALTPSESSLVTSSVMQEKQTAVGSGVYAFLNTSSANLKNKSFRRAIKRAVDLEAVRAAAPSEPILDYPFVSSQIKLSHYPELLAHDSEAAAGVFDKLLDEAGEAGIHLNIATVNSGYMPAVAEAFANELRSYGLDVSVTPYDENQDFIGSVISKRNYDILIYKIELGVDPDVFPYYHSSQASKSGLNLSNFKNSIVDELILGARETTDNALRVAKYESFLDYWVDEVPAIGLYQTNMSYFFNKNVRTFSDDSHFISPFDRFVNVENWAAEKTTKNRTP